ncbi:MAG: alpha/beta hydrolase [Myxococcota bacterium]
MFRPFQSLRLLLSPYRLQSRFYWQMFRRAGLQQTRAEVPCASIRLWQGGAGAGAGAPLLMLHGFGASALWQWYGQVGDLVHGRALFVPDLIGFGGSERRGGRPPSLDLQADAMIEMMDHYGVEQFDILGLSYGGFVGARMVQRWPERVRGIVFSDSPAVGYQLADYHDMIERFQIGHIGDLLQPPTPADVRRLLSIAWVRPPWAPAFAMPDIHRNMFTDRIEEKRALLDEALEMLKGPPMIEHIARPSLIIWGEHDPIFPLHLGARMAARLNSTLRSIARTAHTPNMERPARFNPLVDRFLRQAGG